MSESSTATRTDLMPSADPMQANIPPTAPKRVVEHAAVYEVGNPPKWPDWGIHNYKAVVAYDGTNYKYVSVHLPNACCMMI